MVVNEKGLVNQRAVFIYPPQADLVQPAATAALFKASDV
jgi:hypothetical protein